MSTTIAICTRFAETDNCLANCGYSAETANKEVRRAAMRTAVHRFGLSRVMYRLGALCEKSHVAADDLEHMKEFYPISLKAFGFSMKTDSWTRVTSLCEAAGVYGMVHVLDHIDSSLAHISKNPKNKTRMAWAQTLELLVKDQIQRYGRMPVQLPIAIKEVMRESLPPISLRSYGYNMAMDMDDRRKALTRAINMRGVHDVLDRLHKIAAYNHKDLFKTTAMNADIDFCVNHLLDNQH